MNTATRSLILAFALTASAGAQTAMWGGSPGRNQVSDEQNLPTTWNTETGENVKWRATLGSQAYGGPLIAGDKIFVGTNNQGERDPNHKGDRGVVMAFNRADGTFLWQIAHPKLPAGRVNDWPQQGVCSTPFVSDDRLYYISNRAEVVCLDTEGFLDGENDGPIADETATAPTNADLIWKFDMIAELDVFPHNLATSSPLGVDGRLFALTSNGVDEGHVHIPAPFAPSFIALDMQTGRPPLGQRLARRPDSARPVVQPRLRRGWWPQAGDLPRRRRLGLCPRARHRRADLEIRLQPQGFGLGIGRPRHPQQPRLHARFSRRHSLSRRRPRPRARRRRGHLWAIDASGTGDITETGAIWHFGGEHYNRTISTVAIADGLLYTADLSGFVYCLDAKTGTHHWTHDTFAAVWGSPFVADGKVYIGDEDGDVDVLKAGKTLELLHETNLGSAVYTTPVAHDGVLYIASRNTLFAIAEESP